jgi:hypothetical protein
VPAGSRYAATSSPVVCRFLAAKRKAGAAQFDCQPLGCDSKVSTGNAEGGTQDARIPAVDFPAPISGRKPIADSQSLRPKSAAQKSIRAIRLIRGQNIRLEH